MGYRMWFLPLLALLVVPPTQAHLLGMCFTHQIAFPNGPDHADMSQTLCNLLQENINNLPCDGLTTMTASEFQTEYEASHAEFCQNNAVLVASVVTGTHPEAQKVYETALAETLFVLQATQGEDNANAERRNLGFWDDVADVVSDPTGSILHQALGGVSPEYLALTLLVGNTVAFLEMFAHYMALFGRRALTAPTDATAIAISTNDILSECANGIDSFLCEIPVSQLLQVFSTGVCASVPGLLCVVSPDDLLALGSN